MPEHGGLGGQGDLSSIGLSADQRGNAGGCVPHVEVLAGVEARPHETGDSLSAQAIVAQRAADRLSSSWVAALLRSRGRQRSRVWYWLGGRRR